jgi:hypothetical protein
MRCRCGNESFVRVRELLDGKSTCCRSCSSRKKAQNVSREERVRVATEASLVAAEVAKARRASHPHRVKYGVWYDRMLHKAASIRQRCANPNALSYGSYGGRGIQFEFMSNVEFAQWVLDTLGIPPTSEHSIDRIDNNGNYVKGNLRWATRAEQARNKRAYKRTANGERIRKLQQLRPDVTYETLRIWILQGMTDGDIIKRGKYARTSV